VAQSSMPGDGEVEWTKAHVDVELQVKLQYEQKRLSGNEAADALAKRGAALGAIDLDMVAKVAWADRTSGLIRRRLVAIQKHVLKGATEYQAEEERQRRTAKEQREERNRRKRLRDERPEEEERQRQQR
jgi:hypothetical protein